MALGASKEVELLSTGALAVGTWLMFPTTKSMPDSHFLMSSVCKGNCCCPTPSKGD